MRSALYRVMHIYFGSVTPLRIRLWSRTEACSEGEIVTDFIYDSEALKSHSQLLIKCTKMVQTSLDPEKKVLLHLSAEFQIQNAWVPYQANGTYVLFIRSATKTHLGVVLWAEAKFPSSFQT